MLKAVPPWKEISSKVIVMILTILAGSALIIIHDLQEAGIELPGWVAIAAPILSAIAGVYKTETRLPKENVKTPTG